MPMPSAPRFLSPRILCALRLRGTELHTVGQLRLLFLECKGNGTGPWAQGLCSEASPTPSP